jgi:hypothetical protein
LTQSMASYMKLANLTPQATKLAVA